MTQLEKTQALLGDLQVPYSIDELDTGKILVVEAKSDPRVLGHKGLATEFNFTKEGDFTNMGIWG